MRKLIFGICMGLAILGMLGGCSVTDTGKGEKQAIDYTVVPDGDLPEELRSLIDQKKEKEFRMTYQDGESLYLVRGYGRQELGGCSVRVESLTMGEEALALKTELLGPDKEQTSSGEPSYPYIVVKIEYRDCPVQFL